LVLRGQGISCSPFLCEGRKRRGIAGGAFRKEGKTGNRRREAGLACPLERDLGRRGRTKNFSPATIGQKRQKKGRALSTKESRGKIRDQTKIEIRRPVITKDEEGKNSEGKIGQASSLDYSANLPQG